MHCSRGSIYPASDDEFGVYTKGSLFAACSFQFAYFLLFFFFSLLQYISTCLLFSLSARDTLFNRSSSQLRLKRWQSKTNFTATKYIPESRLSMADVEKTTGDSTTSTEMAKPRGETNVPHADPLLVSMEHSVSRPSNMLM